MVRAGFWWTSSLLGGKHTLGESIAQRSQRSQRGILEGDGASGLLVDVIAFGRETHAIGESIAQRSRRSQRGIGGAMVRAGFRWTSSLLGGKHTLTERASHRGHGGHRGEFGGRWCERALGGRRRFWAGNTRFGESIAQRSRRSQRGFGGRWCERALGWTSRFSRKNTRFGESTAQRSGRDHRPLQPPAKSGIHFCRRPPIVTVARHTNVRSLRNTRSTRVGDAEGALSDSRCFPPTSHATPPSIPQIPPLCDLCAMLLTGPRSYRSSGVTE